MQKDEAKTPKGYTCPACSKFNQFSMYVYAHMQEELQHTCECGKKNAILGGRLIDEPARCPNTGDLFGG